MNDNDNKKGIFDLVGKVVIGIAIGYLSGNAEARAKLASTLKKGKDTISSFGKKKSEDVSESSNTFGNKASATDAEFKIN